jgi:predicted nucleotidyltransferase
MLEKLFTSKTRIKILQYLFFEKESCRIREISRQIDSPASAVKKEINNLEEIGILLKKENEFSINPLNSWKDDLRNIFIKTDYLFYPLSNLLSKNKDIDFALIFGSFARGTISCESDIDLFIVGDIENRGLIKELKKSEMIIKREINPLVWKLEELKRNKSKGLIKDINKNKIIMLKGDEDEFRRIIKQ